MRYITVLLLCILIGNAGISQTTAPDVKEMTVLQYKIKEGGKAYSYTVTLHSVASDEIDFEWISNEKPARKGKVVTDADFSDASADELLVTDFKPGTEELEKSQVRLFVPQSIIDIISNAAMTSIDFNINGKAKTVSLNSGKLGSNGKLLYNGKTITADYSELINSSAGVVLGYIQCDNSDSHLVSFYKDKNTSMELVSIKTAVEEASFSSGPKPLEEKKPAPKKMDGAKWAVVKIKYPTLAKLEDFDPTGKGAVTKPFEETYEYRIINNSPNPPSLVDCFICDLKILYVRREKFHDYTGHIDEELTAKKFPASLVAKLLKVYLKNDVINTPGYRPWTHKQFVNSLTEKERNSLSKEIEAYVTVYGILDVN